MFRAHSPIDRSTRCEVAAYGLCTVRVYSADGAVRLTIRTVHTTIYILAFQDSGNISLE